VSRQFLPALGRTINCQVGLGLFLASRDAGIPVNWRLRLSGRWDEDELLRKRAHIPTEEVSQPVWRYALDMLDEARDEWEMPNVPVVMDVTRTDGNALATALQNRGMPFMLKVDEAFEVRGIQQPRGMAAEPVLPVGHFVNAFTYRPTRPRNPRLLTVPVGLRQRPRPEGEPLHLLATVPESPNRSAYWITNGPLRQLARVTPLTRVDERVRHDLRTLESTFGLRDFEGRSFHGWHHHMTLVSAAYAFAQCG
jgi:hypothetical protein